MLRMTKDDRAQAQTAIALTLRGATRDSSREATDAAIKGLRERETYDWLASELWGRIAESVLDAGVVFGGSLAVEDRDRLIDEICARLGEAMRAPPEDDGD
jgi:hypothetical protein